ncbi:MAG: hypothetical protein IJD01_02265 [Clostridia bacterium]|nr:hypothetical protein [Clostridia bacterium]
MQEHVELVNRGFRALLAPLARYVGSTMKNMYGDLWWSEATEALGRSWAVPVGPSFEERVGALDIAASLLLLDRRWNELFGHLLPRECRSYVNELRLVRNNVAHIGYEDLSQEETVRALDTMALLCQPIDAEASETIRELYREICVTETTVVYEGLAQPASESERGELTEGSLLSLVGTEAVERTQLTRKITYGGRTVTYPVYRVRLDHLFYNDQNDRIATWISQYEAVNGADSLTALDRVDYNRIIEQFVYDSNEESIRKTQKNIEALGQREAGVALADGRVVDGNRRFTCLRRMQRETPQPLYFETVIMDMDIQADKKQIKLLELAIQHGEEKKVDYDLVDLAVGTYRDVVANRLLTVEEYAAAANEPIAEVNKRLRVMESISEFLRFIRLPEQYHIAKDYQVYSLFQEMLAPMNAIPEGERERLKTIVFCNTLMHAVSDQRKFIRDIKSLVRSGAYTAYADAQQATVEALLTELNGRTVHSKADIEAFAEEHKAEAEELRLAMERALLRMRAHQVKARPSENAQKCVSLLMDVDVRTFARLGDEEKCALKDSLNTLITLATDFKDRLE